MVIFEENETSADVIGNAMAPNFTAYAKECGYASDYTSLQHPSLPNYLEATSGVSYDSSPWTSDCEASQPGCSTSNPSIFSQSPDWKGYAESMASNCATSDNGGSAGYYYTRHNPAPYYTSIRAECDRQDVPLGTLSSGALHTDVVEGALPAFSTVTPNGVDDGHDSSVAAADQWIGPWISQITQGPDYTGGRLAIEVVWDEGVGSNQRIPSIWLSAYIRPGTQSSVPMTHYSTLRAAEEIAGVPLLGDAASAEDPRSAFGF